jgi:hypothetical protein
VAPGLRRARCQPGERLEQGMSRHPARDPWQDFTLTGHEACDISSITRGGKHQSIKIGPRDFPSGPLPEIPVVLLVNSGALAVQLILFSAQEIFPSPMNPFFGNSEINAVV